MRALVVVDYQNDFVDGALGFEKAKDLEGPICDKIEEYLKGNTCGHKPTSCADQLALGVRAAHDKEAAEQ